MHDYVIVGAGSAGCVLAARLSEDPDVRVALIEAGPPDTADTIHMPAGFAANFRTQNDWDLDTAPEGGCNRRRIYLPRGRVLGGSSSLNAMVYIRGCALDYDEWSAAGNTGWGFEDLLPYFKLAEDNERGASRWHGAGGPLGVAEGRSNNPLAAAFVESALAAGHPANDDFNGDTQDGFGFYQVTQRNGLRASTAAAYLRPAMERANLDVIPYTHVNRVLFESGRAIGIEAQRLGEVLEFRAEREVILCAGTYMSPQLLMLSGIGRPDELALLQIETVAESPAVGLNLSDHINVGGSWFVNEPLSLKDALTPENVALFESEGRGPLTSNIAESGGFIRTRDGLEAPDMQVHFAPVVFADEGLAPPPDHGFAVGACVLKPKSRGYVAITSPDPTAKPLVFHNYFGEPDDLATATRGLRQVLEILDNDPIASLIREVYLGPADDAQETLEASARANSQTLYHPVGTCSMGTVVNSDLAVNGVEGLRVVDCSVMPTVPRGNTNAPVIALAERAADLIRGRTPLCDAEPAVAAAT